MNIKTPLRTMIKVSDTHGWAAGKVGLYLGYNAQYDTVKVGFVNEAGEYTGEFTKVPRSAASVVETKPTRKPAKTPAGAIARVLRDMGLVQGKMGDFVVTGHKENGERVGTYVVLLNRTANDLVDKEADTIERLSAAEGFPFHVSTRYHHESGHAYPDICNFGERVRRARPGAEGADKPATAVTDKPTHVRNVLNTVRKAGFVMTFPPHGTSGTVQFGHHNENVLMVEFVNGRFKAAKGYGWGAAPWTDTPWDTYDFETFVGYVNE